MVFPATVPPMRPRPSVPPPSTAPLPTPKKSSGRVIFLLLLVVVIAAGGAIFLMYRKNIDLQTQLTEIQSDPNRLAQEEVQQTIDAVARHMILPQNETPTVATVTDPEALKNQQFFMDAKVGNKVLIYPLAKKAILYDATLDRIVEVTSITLGGAQPPVAEPSADEETN